MPGYPAGWAPGAEFHARWPGTSIQTRTRVPERGPSRGPAERSRGPPSAAGARPEPRSYICLKRGPSAPSGGSQRMFSFGHFTAQVMQWRQFEAERTIFSPSQR